MLGGKLRRRGPHDRDRGIPERRGSQLHRHRRRHDRCCRWPPPRITSAATMATGAPTPAAWAPIPRPHRHAGAARPHHARSDRAHPARAARRRQSLHGISLRRTDDCRGRHAQRARVQLPLRRSGDPADSDAPAKRSGRSLRGRAGRPALDRCRSSPGIRAPRSAWSWRPAAIRTAYRNGDAISGLDAAAAAPGQGISTPGPRRGGREDRHRPAGACCAQSGWAPPSRLLSQAYDLVHAIHWNLVQYRRDIGYRAVARERKAR